MQFIVFWVLCINAILCLAKFIFYSIDIFKDKNKNYLLNILFLLVLLYISIYVTSQTYKNIDNLNILSYLAYEFAISINIFITNAIYKYH